MTKDLQLEKRTLVKIQKYKQLFESDLGLQILHDLCRRFGMYKSTYVSEQPYESAYREGRRSVILEICQMLKLDPVELDRIIKED